MCPDPSTCDTETLVNRIAHALRNPIFAASLQAELAAGRSPDPAIGKLMQHLSRLNTLIDEMLLLGRPAHIELRDVEPVRLLAKIAESMTSDASTETGPVIHISAASGPGRARWDPSAVQHILTRLLKNAIENSPPPHTITIELTQPSEHQAAITVIDTGQGIADDLKAHIFEPFFPQHLGRPGLGLAIALKFAKALGGTIELVPNPGGGTRATLVLPLRAESSRS